MEIEQIILNKVESLFPNSEVFLMGSEEFNQTLDNTSGISFPVLFLDKYVNPKGVITQAANLKETAKFTLIALCKPEAFEIKASEQIHLIETARDMLRSILVGLAQSEAIANYGKLQDGYDIKPVFFRFDAHLIGASLEFSVEYFPDVEYCIP